MQILIILLLVRLQMDEVNLRDRAVNAARVFDEETEVGIITQSLSPVLLQRVASALYNELACVA